jgi:hypothetical protein
MLFYRQIQEIQALESFLLAKHMLLLVIKIQQKSSFSDSHQGAINFIYFHPQAHETLIKMRTI